MVHDTEIGLTSRLGAHIWHPRSRAVAGLAGVLGLSYAIGGARRSWRWIAGVTGGAALMRAVTGLPLLQLGGLFFMPVITLRKEVDIEAPAFDVYRYWSDVTHYPRFMSFIEKTQVNQRGGFHWRLRGPAGTVLEWDALITEMIPQQVFSWRSEPGAVLTHAGSIRLQTFEFERTRVVVELSWAPPAGMLGFALGRFLGFDPRETFEQDVMRMKKQIEESVSGKREDYDLAM